MAQHPFLKSIHPVNLLSFGPKTEPIELRPLNILIGANGSGKSNFIEAIRFLSYLPDKEPWETVVQTGGIDEWIWKGPKNRTATTSLSANISLENLSLPEGHAEVRTCAYSIHLGQSHSSFSVKGETFDCQNLHKKDGEFVTSFESNGTSGTLLSRQIASNLSQHLTLQLNPEKSILSQRTSRSLQESLIGKHLPELFEIADFFEDFDFHQDWEFGVDLTPRDPIPTGQSVERLDENARNLAQMLAYFRDYHRPIFARINELMKNFYAPFEGLEIRNVGSHLQIAFQEKGDFSTSAYRLSDGTLRWLSLLTVLLNPTPAPITCLEEPELGLHPDAIHTLADLLVEASTRTQLIVTTHSDALLDAFGETPEAVCVCEKVEGSTVIRRLDKKRLQVWLNEYSLGHLWMSGEIGGNRW